MNLSMLLDMAADSFGDRVMLGRREDGLTAVQLRDRSAAGAALIREAGADAVVYFDINGPAFPIALFSAAKAGVPLIPVNYRLGREQLDSLLSKHHKAIGIAGKSTSGILERAGLQTLLTEKWLAVTAEKVSDSDIEDDAGEAPAVVIYTSGTTSEPKGVLLHHSNLVSYVLGTVEFASAEPSDAALISVPPYHIAAVANAITNLYAGRRSITLEKFTPEQWLNMVNEQGVTNAMVVPTMLARIVESDGDKHLPTLRSLAYGGSLMPPSVIERAFEIWPDMDFVNAYGLTETSSTVAVLGPEDHREAFRSNEDAVRARLLSVGRAVPSVEIEIRDDEGSVVGPGIVGRVCVRGDQVSAEYAGVGKVLDDRGFFDTRDRGHLDEGDYLFIEGRADDTIIRGAENIAPTEVENILLRHPAVLDAAVVGVPDEEWGQRIEAAVVRRSSDLELDEHGLKEFVRAVLRGSKTPDRIVAWDELPRTDTGKLLRRSVLDRLLAEG